MVSSTSLMPRRVLVAGLTLGTILGTTFLLVAILLHGKFGFTAVVAVAAFLVNITWVALGFWNAVIGFFLLRGSRKPSTRLCPETRPIGIRSPQGASRCSDDRSRRWS